MATLRTVVLGVTARIGRLLPGGRRSLAARVPVLAVAAAIVAGMGMGMGVGVGAAAAATVVDDRGERVMVNAEPQRIVSMLPSLTETVCALNACDRLVGTDRWSNWPASVRTLPKLGGLEDAQIERIVALRPDLVLVPGSSRALARLQSLGLTVLALEPQSLADTRRVIDAVALALGRPADGAALWRRMDSRITEAAGRVPPAWRGRRVYFEVSSAPHAAGEASFVGELLARLALGNVVPASLGSFPKLNPEFVVRAQPDLVMATASELAAMRARPGWAGLVALRDGAACGFAAEAYDVLVRPGPRLADAADLVADCLSRLGRPGTPATAPAAAHGTNER